MDTFTKSVLNGGRRLIVLAALLPTLAWCGFEDCEEYVAYGIPSDSGDQLCRIGYALAHDSERKTPLWVAEHLTRERAMAQATRKDMFAPDPDLQKGKRAELRDYKSSGFDRGHMAPNGDFNWDPNAAAQSFYLSNMVPQNGPMNRGIWKLLETDVRLWAVRHGEVMVYTGPIYKAPVKTIGTDKVAVPTSLFKIIYDAKTDESIAFILPNEAIDAKELPNYVTSIKEIEAQTGLHFLTALPEERRVKITERTGAQ
jgi:endonuclease G